jgi:hypothetical protein
MYNKLQLVQAILNMTQKNKYPLDQLMRIKKKRFDQALEVLEEKTRLLKQEQVKLHKKERSRDEVLDHKDDKIAQLREELDSGTTTDKIQQMKYYLEVVDERLLKKENEVKDQKDVVKQAIKAFDVAKNEMIARKKDLEKLEIHKKQWRREMKYYENREIAKEQDELGSARHSVKKQEEKERKEREK